jgi:hypothetical protein
MGDVFSSLKNKLQKGKGKGKGKGKSKRQLNNNSDDDSKTASTMSLAEKADSMQLVADNIFMGSAVAANNFDLLKRNGITHILAIGYNLEEFFPDDFEYLLLNGIEDRPGFIIIPYFAQCFTFLESAGRAFVHCHKGLSRSATVIIAYEMFRNERSFDTVLDEIRRSRSFIMPNIGFQSQLKLFEEKKYSLDMREYSHLDLDILGKISQFLPRMQASIEAFYALFEQGQYEDINDQELFGLTMYVHQVFMLDERQKLNESDSAILRECIRVLRCIQTQFIQDEISLARFDKMFTV